MATSKRDRRELYPLTLWISIGGALLGAFQFGYQIGVLNTALYYVTKDLTYDNEAVLSSAVVLGAMFGAICSGKFADKVGPKTAQIVNAVPFIIGAVLSAVSPHRHVGFLAGRVISGLGAGAASLYTPRYIAEIAPTSLRGRLGSQNQVFINVGILVAYSAGIPYENDFTGFEVKGHFICWWRVMIAASIVPVVAQVLVLLFCPESPVWLESQGDRESADVSCIRLWGPYAIVPDMESEDANLLNDEEDEAAQRTEGWTGLLKPQYKWMMMLALGLPLLQQASGINTVIYYSSSVFQDAGLQSPITGSIFMGLINVSFTLVAAAMMDKMGRKPLLQASFAGMAGCLAVVALIIYVPTSLAVQGMLTVTFILLYVCAFALGVGPIPWIVLSEILPPRIKGPAASLATTCCWAGNLLVTLSFNSMLDTLGIGGSYLLYAAFNCFGLWYVSTYMVETKCRTLPEIEEMLLLPEESWPSRTQALLAGSARHRNTHQQNGSLNAHQQQEHDNIEQKTDTEAGDGQQ
eukprot:jgi/Chrzof1/9167/Cz03g38140.t1